MQEAVEQRGGERGVVVEDFGPGFERPIGAHQDGAALVALGDDLEQQVGAELVDGEIPDFVHDDQRGFQIALHGALEGSGAGGGREGVDDVDGAGEQHRVAAGTRGLTQGDTQVSFAETDGAQEDHVGLLLDEVQTEEVLDLRSVDFLRPAPLELIEGLLHREARPSDALRETFILAAGHLALDQALQVIEVPPALLGGGLGEFMVIRTDMRQLQALQQFGEGVAVALLVVGMIIFTHRLQPRRWINQVRVTRCRAGLPDA